MKSIFIDSENKTITDIDLKGDLQSWYDIIKCELVEVAHYFNDHDSIMVDEEGMLKSLENFFSVEGSHQEFFAGNGLVVGVDKEGNTVDCKLRAKDIKEKITFKDLNEIRTKLYNL